MFGLSLKSVSDLFGSLFIKLLELLAFIVRSEGVVMVLCREYWGRVTIAVEKMLESFDAILKELVKCPLLLFMEVFKLLLVFN